MSANPFSGPLAAELAAFAATLEASASANKTTLTQLRALDRLTIERGVPSGTIDETLAMAWLAESPSRGPNTRRSRYYLLRRFCRFLASRQKGTFVPGESLRPRRRLVCQERAISSSVRPRVSGSIFQPKSTAARQTSVKIQNAPAGEPRWR